MDKITIHSELCTEMHALYKHKNADYGDSFAQLRKRYPNFVCMRLFDKLNRLDTIIQPGYKCKVSDEKIEDTLMDIANYAIMELTERRAERPFAEEVVRRARICNGELMVNGKPVDTSNTDI